MLRVRALRLARVLERRKLVHALVAERRVMGARLLDHAHEADARQIWIAVPFPVFRVDGPLESWEDAPRSWRQVVGVENGRHVRLDDGSVMSPDGCEWFVVADQHGQQIDFHTTGFDIPACLDPDTFFRMRSRPPGASREALEEPAAPGVEGRGTGLTWPEARELVEAALRDEAIRGLDGPHVILDDRTEALSWGWIVHFSTEDFVRTRSMRHMLVGAGPYLVDRYTGEIIRTGSGTDLKSVIRQHERKNGYRPWWRIW